MQFYLLFCKNKLKQAYFFLQRKSPMSKTHWTLLS
jgi:hypothetical protein